MMSIQTNVNALSAQRGLGVASGRLQDAMAKLSSGYRINKAADDAAGLAISEKMKAQVSGLNQAMRNSMDAVSLVQTAEGALGEITGMVQRMRVLAVQSASDVNTAEDRNALQLEVSALQSEISRLANATDFNGLNLLDGSFQSKTFQVGAFKDQTIDVNIADARATALGAFKHAAAGTNMGASSSSNAITASVVTGDTLTISGSTGAASVGVAAGATAKVIAADVNAQFGTTGVKAEAVTYLAIDSISAAGAISFDLNGGGSSRSISATIASTNDLSALRDAINASSGATGVTAELGTSQAEIILTQAEGEDITLDNYANNGATNDNFEYRALQSDKSTTLGIDRTNATDPTNDGLRVTGAVDFFSTEAYNIAGDTGETINGAAQNVATVTSIGAQTVATQAGASSAIDVIDSALEKLNSMRAELGAAQNRFETTAAALESSSENLSAANSRIRDVDVASESAELARAQVLSQAGVSVLAQANQLPQMALKLLG